jgi:hypothetical protein
MNRKMICKVLEKKHIEFLSTITDDTVKRLVAKNSIVTGGSIASMLLREPIKDFDYYFTNKETCVAVAKYYVDRFNEAHPDNTYLTTTKLTKPTVEVDGDRVKVIVPSAGIVGEGDNSGYQYFESLPDEVGEGYVDKVTAADDIIAEKMEEIDKEKGICRPIFMSSNAITLSHKVQLVIRFYGDPEDIHKNYDFIHCCNYWRSEDRKLVLHPAALESLLSKHLSYQGSLYPLCSVIRTRKFLKNGWYINAGQYLKMCFQLSELDLSNIDVLEEQLTGVDAAYFHQVIEYCKKRQEEDGEFKITAPYLVSIVDKIFG